MSIEDKLSNYINKEIDFWNFSGVIRVLQNGKIIFETSRGFANIEFGIKNSMTTRFSIASVTKQFTAFAIMILYDKGLLKLDEKANQYLPSNIQISSNITVHHLMSHTSGLYNFYNFEDDFYVDEDRAPYNKNSFLTDWINKKQVNEPGTVFNYNNSNYNLLAWIIENISGQTYNEFLTANIFIPLGMSNTEYDNGQNILKQKAYNYMHELNQYRLGNSISAIMCGDLPKISCKPEETFVSLETLEIYSGTYLPGKIHIEVKGGKLYLVRVNQNIHIELYCVGNNLFMRRYEEQQEPHNLFKEGAIKPSVWGYELVSKQFI